MKLHILYQVLDQPESLPRGEGDPDVVTGRFYGIFYSIGMLRLVADRLRKGATKSKLYAQTIDVEEAAAPAPEADS